MNYKTASIELCILNSNLHDYPDFYTGIEIYITPQTDLTEVGQQYLELYEAYKLQLVPTVVKMGDWDVKVCMFENVPACIIYCPISIRDNVPIFIVENGEAVYTGEGKIYAGLMEYDENMSKQATKKEAVFTYLCNLKSPSSEYEEWLLIRSSDIMGMSPVPVYVYIYYNKNFISISRHSGSSTYPYIPEDIAAYDESDADYSSINTKESAKTRIKCKLGETILIESNLSALNVILDSIWGDVDVEDNEFLPLINVGNSSYYYTVQNSFTSDNEEIDTILASNLYVFASSNKYQLTVRTLELPVSYSIYYTNSNKGYNNELWVRYNASSNQTVYNIEKIEPSVGDDIEIRFEFDSSENYTLSSFKIERRIIKTNVVYTFFDYYDTFDMPNSDVEILWYITATSTGTEPPPPPKNPCTVSVVENKEGHRQTEYITNIWINELETKSLEVEKGSEVTIRWKLDTSKPVTSVYVRRTSEDKKYLIKGIEGSCTLKIYGRDVITLFACGDPLIFDVTTVENPQTILDTTGHQLINSHPVLWGMSLYGFVFRHDEEDGKFMRQYWIPSEKITKVPYNNNGEEIITPLAGGVTKEKYKRHIPDGTMCYLPNTITKIEPRSCIGCHFQIVIPDSVSSIGKMAFSANYNTKFARLPNTLRNLNGQVFDDCHGLGGIIGGASIKGISLWASVCAPLLYIVIPESVTTLYNSFLGDLDNGLQEDYLMFVSGIFIETRTDTIYWKAMNCSDASRNAFSSCRQKIKTVIFGPVVLTIDLEIFGMFSLDTIVFLGTLPPSASNTLSLTINLKLVAPLASKDLYLNHDFWGKYKDKFEFVSDVSAEYLFPIKYTTTNRLNLWPYRVDFLDLMPVEDVYSGSVGGQLRFVKPLLTIGDWMYAGQLELASITLPSTITKIGENAFYRCKNLTTINIPKNVTNIASTAFEESGISNVHWDVAEYTAISGITDSPFYNCQQVKTLTIGPNVKSIPRFMFGYLKIQEINIPWTVESIGTYAFSYCKDLKKVSIGANVKEIGDYAFIHAPIEEIEWSSYADLNPFSFMESIKTVVFNEAYVSNIPLMFCLNMSNLQSVNIPKKATKILQSTFCGCSSLKNVSLPEGLIEIQYSAFEGCSSLESITIPSSVTSINASAFTGCTFLRDKFINNSSLDAEANNYWGATILD